jgi:integrase
MRTWGAEQLRAFLEHERADRLYALWVVLATTGMRRGEALGLGWDDIDLANRRVAIRRQTSAMSGTLYEGPPKGGRARVVALDDATLQVLHTHRARQAEERLRLGAKWSDRGLVFAHDGNRVEGGAAGGPLHPERLSRTFRRRVVAHNADPANAKLP